MNQLYIRGGRTLEGEVRVQGAKNSVLPILAATLADAGTSALGGLSPPAGRGRLHPDPAGSGVQCPVGGGHPGGGHRRLEPVFHL